MKSYKLQVKSVETWTIGHWRMYGRVYCAGMFYITTLWDRTVAVHGAMPSRINGGGQASRTHMVALNCMWHAHRWLCGCRGMVRLQKRLVQCRSIAHGHGWHGHCENLPEAHQLCPHEGYFLFQLLHLCSQEMQLCTGVLHQTQDDCDQTLVRACAGAIYRSTKATMVTYSNLCFNNVSDLLKRNSQQERRTRLETGKQWERSQSKAKRDNINETMIEMNLALLWALTMSGVHALT